MRPKLVDISNAFFKRSSAKNAPPIFKKPINFSVHESCNWLVVGPQKSVFLSILGRNYLCDPPLSRKISPGVSFLRFNDTLGIDKEHLSARYESFSSSQSINNTVSDFIWGTYNYNQNETTVNKEYVESLIKLFRLDHLLNTWVVNLSNGQTRRLKLVRSLVKKPTLLVVDDPFLGLDVKSTELMWNILGHLSREHQITLVLGLRDSDVRDHPFFENELVLADQDGISKIPRETLHTRAKKTQTIEKVSQVDVEDPHIEFSNASIKYGDKVVLADLNWSVPRGTSWRIIGNNGTGKTTLLSIITCDHPQSWKSIISINGVTRKAGSGQSFFKINNQIGISSPELHALVPSHKTMREVILNGLVPNIGNSNFAISFKGNVPEFAQRVLNDFNDILANNGDTNFGELCITHQKLALFLRAIIKKPEILLLDEAFSCFDDDVLLERCQEAIPRYLGNCTIFMIGHIDWELPRYDYALTLNDDKSYTISKTNN